MIKKHPTNRAERLMINEKKKKDKRKDIESFSDRPSGTLPSNIDEWGKDS